MSDEPQDQEPGNTPMVNNTDEIDLVQHDEPPRVSDDGIVEEKNPADLQAVFDVPVKVSAILGRSRMKVNDLMNMGRGTILELDRKVGESIDIFVNNRLIARGEVVLVDNQLGVTMTEIISQD